LGLIVCGSFGAPTIAATGQSLAQAVQPPQSAVMLYAKVSPPIVRLQVFYHRRGE